MAKNVEGRHPELCESFGELAVPIPFANKFDCVGATCVGRAWKQCLWDHGFTWWFTVVFITKKALGKSCHSPIFTQVFKYCCKYWLEVIWFVFKRSLRFRFDPICQFGLLHVRFNCPCGSPRDDGRKKRRGPVWDPGLISIHPSKGAIWTLRDGVQGPLIIHSTHLGRSRYMDYLYIHSMEWLPTLIRAVTHWELCISQFLVEDSHFASPGRTESKIESQSSRGTVAGPVFPTTSAKSFR